MESQHSAEWRARMLRSWHLAMLRFAVTRDHADKLVVLAAANEIDRLGSQDEDRPHFRFFRRMTSTLCAAIVERDEAARNVLREYVRQIDDARLKHALAAALDIEHSEPSAAKRRSKPVPSLWRGLPARNDIQY